MNRFLYYLIVLAVILGACATVQPMYKVGVNSYLYQSPKLFPNNLVAAHLIYTYQTDKLEGAFQNMFCANLSDCSANIQSVKTNAKFGGFDLNQRPIANNLQRIKDIQTYQLLYTTKGVWVESRVVSGAVFLPVITKQKIKGVILFFHPTYFSKGNAPSYTPDKYFDTALAAVFASQGYIVLAPDYIGMGYDTTAFHPYVLYPQANASDGLAMVVAAQQFLQPQGLVDNQHTLPLYVSGYSEGGAYALWFSRLYQEQIQFKNQLDATPFKLTKVVPIAGAYDLSGVMYSYLFSDVGAGTKAQFNVQSSILASKIKPSLLAYSLNAYAYYNESQNYTKVFNPEFFNMGCPLQSNGQCLIESQPNVFTTFDNTVNQTDDMRIVNKINGAASYAFMNSSIFMNQWNEVTPLVNPDLVNDGKFMRFLSHSDIYFWHSIIPTTLIYFADDSVVSSLNSMYAYQGMLEAGSSNLNSISLDNSVIQSNISDYLPNFNVDHLTGYYYLFIVALNQFNHT